MKFFITTIFILTSLITFGQTKELEELWRIYMSKDFDKTISNAHEVFKNDSNNIDYKLLVGRALTDKGDFNSAIPYLEFTVNNDSENSYRKAWALSYLGTCFFMLQDYGTSETSLKECLELNATKNVTKDANEKTLLFGFNEFYKEWKIIESDNFRFHFQKMSDSDIATFVSSREEAFLEINKFFNSTLPRKIDFFVWDSMEDAKNVLGVDLGFSRPDFCVIHSYYQQTKGHEIAHVISNYYSKNLSKTYFINEGTAVCFDLTHRDKIQTVKNVIKDKGGIVDIDFIWQGNKIDESILYPVAGAFVEYLIMQGGKSNFLELFKNQTLENAYEIYGDSLTNWMADFELNFSTEFIVKDTSINYQTQNIKQIDQMLKNQNEERKLGKKPLILINGNAYTFEEFVINKLMLSGLKQDKISNIFLVPKNSKKTLKDLEKAFKKSTKHGILFVEVGDQKKHHLNNFE